MKIDPLSAGLAARLAETGLRSPATVNAFGRFADRVLSKLDGETRAAVEDSIVEAAAQVAAFDDGDVPYGHSVEHAVKRLLNDPAIKKALKAAARAETPEPVAVQPTPVDDPQPVEPPATLTTETAPAPTRLDRSV